MKINSVKQILTKFTKICDDNNLDITVEILTTNNLKIIFHPHCWYIEFDCLAILTKQGETVWIPFDTIAQIKY